MNRDKFIQALWMLAASVFFTHLVSGQVPLQYYTPTLASLKQAPVIPDTINVGKNCNFVQDSNLLLYPNPCSSVEQVDMDIYIKTVVASEMSATWGLFDTKFTQGAGDEGLNALKAQAVAARSFGINYAHDNDERNNRKDFLVCNSTECQSFLDTNQDSIEAEITAFQPAIDAEEQTRHYVLVDATNPEEGIAPPFFAASTNSLDGPGKDDASQLCSQSDGYTGDPGFGSGPGDYFAGTGFPCHPDAVLDVNGDTTGVFPNRGYPRATHGAGMSQSGALHWAIGTEWNPKGQDYTNPSIDSTEFADPNDIGDIIGENTPTLIDDFKFEDLKDWRQILMHYYVYPFGDHQSIPGPNTRVYQLSVAHTDSSLAKDDTLQIEAGTWEGIEVKFLNDVKAYIGLDSTETLTLKRDEAGRQTYIICEEGAFVRVRATAILEEQDVEATCHGDEDNPGKIVFEQGATVQASNACIQAGKNGNVTVSGNKTLTFKNGGFLSNQDGVFAMDANAQISIESSAGTPEIRPGSSFSLGQNAKILLDRDSEFSGGKTHPIDITGGIVDIKDGHAQFWHTDIDTDSFIIRDGASASFYADSGGTITIRPGFKAELGSTFKATTTAADIPNPPYSRGYDPELRPFILKPIIETDEGYTEETETPENDEPGIIIESYPNPFNPTTTIRYRLETDSFVTLKVYNMLGQEVNTLVSEFQTKGVWESRWDGSDKAGVSVASGTYLYSITAGDISLTGKMVLVK